VRQPRWSRRQATVLLTLVLATSVVAASCRSGTGLEVQLRMQVAPDSVTCVGALGPQQCLSVRELVGGDAWGGWQPLFESIEGFSHETGYLYDLHVARRTIRNPPADGSSVAYRLIRIVSRTVSGG
jgi:hypothetical protein